MIPKKRYDRWVPVFLAVLSAACNATGDARPAAAAALCTRHHGFDPAAPDLPARGLATGELAWGACMRGELAARPTGDVALDEAREELLALHRRLTAEVAAGELGRDEARSRLRGAIAAARAEGRAPSMAEIMATGREAEYHRQRERISRQAWERALLGR